MITLPRPTREVVPRPTREVVRRHRQPSESDVVHDHIRLRQHQIGAVACILVAHRRPAHVARGHDRQRRDRGRLVGRR